MLTFQKSEDMYTFSDSVLCAAGTDSGIFFSVVVSTPEPVTHMFDHQLQLEVMVKNSTCQSIHFLTLAKNRMDRSAKTLNICVHSSLCDIDPQV